MKNRSGVIQINIKPGVRLNDAAKFFVDFLCNNKEFGIVHSCFNDYPIAFAYWETAEDLIEDYNLYNKQIYEKGCK